jgi:hypothetical protein
MASAQILTNGKALYAYNGTEWVPLNTSGNLVNSTRWQKVAAGGETTLSGNDDSGESLIYTPGYEQVYLNGVLLARDADYTATTGTTITGLAALTAGYIVEVIAYNNINVGNTYTQAQIDNKVANTFTRWVETLSASATVLSGLDDNANTLSYTPGLEQVYVNGILLLPSEYTATSGSSVVLSEAAVSGDVIQVYTLKNFRVPNTYTIAQTDDQFLTKTSASSTYLSQASASSTYAPVAAGGLVQIVPTSIATTGGSGSISATGAVSFTSASAISLNGCFNSTYNAYKVLVDITASSASSDLSFKYRTAGTDLSNTYYGGFTGLNHSGTGVTWAINNSSGAKVAEFVTFTKRAAFVDLSLYGPFLTDTKAATWNVQCVHTSSSTGMGGAGGVSYDTAGSASDGISFIKSSGTMSGSIRVYGYRN